MLFCAILWGYRAILCYKVGVKHPKAIVSPDFFPIYIYNLFSQVINVFPPIKCPTPRAIPASLLISLCKSNPIFPLLDGIGAGEDGPGPQSSRRRSKTKLEKD